MSEEPRPEKGLPSSWIVFAGCPKCGATVPRVKYVSASGYGHYEWDGRWWPFECRKHEGEHFDCRCWRCGWQWGADEKGAWR